MEEEVKESTEVKEEEEEEEALTQNTTNSISISGTLYFFQ